MDYKKSKGNQQMSSGRDAFLIEPIFGYSKNDDTPYRPTAREILCEWIDAVNFVKYPSRRLTVVYVAFHFFGLTITVLLCLVYASLTNLFFVVITVCFLGIVYNTIWYHRYCSHASFRFRRPWYNQLFLWTNPFVFREECYAIPHRIHHQLAERPGDPYGPHLGWLGSYLAIESSQKFNINISEKSYQTMVESIRHIGFHVNHYDTFKKTGAIEATNYYLARILFIQLLWGTVSLSLGGIELLLAWHTSVFVMAFIIRDFNWRGHGGNFRHIKKARWEFDTRVEHSISVSMA